MRRVTLWAWPSCHKFLQTYSLERDVGWDQPKLAADAPLHLKGQLTRDQTLTGQSTAGAVASGSAEDFMIRALKKRTTPSSLALDQLADIRQPACENGMPVV